MKKILFLYIICFSLTKAQVVISNNGDDIHALKGALLQVGNQDSSSGEATVINKGFVLPRVELEDMNGLQPLVAVSDTLGQNKIHTGTLVYNMKEGSNYTEGVYYWDGKKWSKMLYTPPSDGGKPISESLLFYSTQNELGVGTGGSVNNPNYFSRYNFTIPGGALVANNASYIDYLFRFYRTGGAVDAWYGIIKFTDTVTGVTYTYVLPGLSENLETGQIFFNQGTTVGSGTLSIVRADGVETAITGITGKNDIVVSFGYYTVGVVNKGNMDYAKFNLIRAD
ncbi:hypothetical protein [Chryseobacterium sp.]|uniref:hypothetical protein n=1 Tax=Chryseobacterium sp. TaxID=1871047 RepID=UPI0025B967A1|nr:hypothetical protein [Chryseobacterium sp.]